MSNVLSAISHSSASTPASVAYLLSGNKLNGNFLGADLSLLSNEKTPNNLEQALSKNQHVG
ncbi:MAG: hypothetical protein KAH22_05970 [Thiotrichaceae bacterium]|nr:hypothetical protein [Thiotrichaceae bacterium]